MTEIREFLEGTEKNTVFPMQVEYAPLKFPCLRPPCFQVLYLDSVLKRYMVVETSPLKLKCYAQPLRCLFDIHIPQGTEGIQCYAYGVASTTIPT